MQNLGETSFDTKFDLTADPGRFMLRSLNLWNQDSSFGELQNQAYGYLFPQGALFWVGEQVGLADWVAQRLWSGLLLVVAFEGTRRLWLAMTDLETGHVAASSWAASRRAASSWSAIVGGLAFALAPRLLGLVGVLSAEVLPTAILPWVVLPIVLAQRGRLTPRTGALLSATGVLFMGGVNAVENLAALPLPALFVLATVRRPAGGRLAVWWVGGVAFAAAWWMLPLLVLGKYSPPFLDYIETSIAVVQPLGWVNTLRGADHWVSYHYVGGQPWWPGSFDLSTRWWLIGLTTLVTAIGLLGISQRRMPWRRPLAISLLLGAVCMTISRSGPLATPVHETFQVMLDGPLSMLRNVHKVDPLVRLPLALGVAHVCGLLLGRQRQGATAGPRRRGTRVVAVWLVVALVIAAAAPVFSGRLRKPGWTEIPNPWHSAAAYLAGPEARGATLVLPGSSFGQQWWGWTIDEPIQGIATSPWVTRSQVPLTPGETIRMLDSIENRIADGLGSPSLADMLARSGVGQVLVRRDIDLFASAVPAPARVDLAIARSPGLEKVAGFGRSGFGEQALIDIYRVERTVAPVDIRPLDDVATLAGAPDDILTALESGDLRPDQPVVIAGEDGWPSGAPDLVGDGYRKRERAFGRLNDAVGAVMTEDEEYRTQRAANDYPGPAGSRHVVAEYDDVAALAASSSGGYTDTFGNTRADLGPNSAFDGRPTTYWQSAPLEDPEGQWVQATFKEPKRVNEVTVVAGTDGITGLPVRELEISAGDQVQRVEVRPAKPTVRVRFAGDSVRTVRVSVTKVAGRDGVAAIRDIRVGGVDLDRRLVVPDSGADAGTSFVLSARPHRRACFDGGLGVSCSDASQARPSDEEAGISREVTVAGAGEWDLSGKVVALPSASTESLLSPINQKVRVAANSTFLGEPSVAAQFAYDGNPATAWRAQNSVGEPTLTLTWPTPRFISRVRLVPPTGDAIAPTGAIVSDGRGHERLVEFGIGNTRFKPLATDTLKVTFDERVGDDEGIGVGDLLIDGLDDLRYPMDRSRPTGDTCGIGPELRVDGKVYPTKVEGKVADLLDGTPLRLEGCSGPIRLGEGQHRIEMRSTSRFAPTLVNLRSAAAEARGPASKQEAERTLEVLRWESNDRTIEVGSGPESLLIVHENVNAGWRVALGDQELRRVRIDGWQQGYVLPAGEGGQVTLTFTPNRLYRLALLTGGLLALMLALGALLSARADRGRGTPIGTDSGAGARRTPWPVGLLALAAAYVVGGPAVAAGSLAGFVGLRRRRAWLVGAFLFAGAGVTAAIAVRQNGGLPPVWCDAVAGAALGCVAAGVLLDRSEPEEDESDE